jgi:hypothetical protein
VVDALEQLRDNADENSDTRADAGSLLHNVLNFSFLVLLPFWRSVLQPVNRIQKRLKDPTMNVQDAAADLVGLKDIISSRGKQFCLDAMQGVKRCEDWNVEINHRTRRKKKMPGEEARLKTCCKRNSTRYESSS